VDWGEPVAQPPRVQKTALEIPTTMIDRGHYFSLSGESWRTYKFQAGSYTMKLFAFDDNDKEFIVRTMNFGLTLDQIGHMKAREGVYFHWDATEKVYRPQLSDHTPSLK
jgi:hypothetical protein